ncbi:MAG: tetratricopeptide repeat protein [Candidatus Thorarchaeota archaeon]
MTRYSPVQIVKAIKSADTAFKSKDYQKAILRYKKAASMDSKQPLIWFRMGLSYYFLNNYFEAIKAYETAYSLEKHYEIAINKGLAYLAVKDFDKAEKSFNQALQQEKGPNDSKIKGEIYLQLGRTLLAKKDLKKALKMLERSEKCLEPPLKLIFYFKGEIYLLQEKIDLAIDNFSKTLEIDDTFKDAVIKLVLIYMDQNNKENALKLLTSFLKQDTEHPEFWNIRGDIHRSMNDFKNAEYAYNQALSYEETDSDKRVSLIGLIKTYIQLNSIERANELVDKMLEENSKNIEAHSLKADLLWLQNDKKQEAIKYFEDNVHFYFPDNDSVNMKLSEY